MAVEFVGSNTVKLNGHRYVASLAIPGKCDRCAFKAGFGCLLAAELYRIPENLDKIGLTRCQARFREDGNDIIWVLPGQD